MSKLSKTKEDPAPAYGQSSKAGTSLPISIIAAMDHATAAGDVETKEIHERRIQLPDAFHLPHVCIQIRWWPGKRPRLDIRIEDRKAGLVFNTLKGFMTHLRTVEYDSSNVFNVEVYIDSARKQIRFENNKKPVINPCLANQFACTPDCVYRFLQQEWNLKLSEFDPAPRNPVLDGLSIPWPVKDGEVLYLNAPFKHMQAWCEKLLHEMRQENVGHAVLMVPGRIKSNWFHDTVLKFASKVAVSRQSLRFKGYKNKYATGVLLAEFTAPLTPAKAGVPFLSYRLHDWD